MCVCVCGTGAHVARYGCVEDEFYRYITLLMNWSDFVGIEKEAIGRKKHIAERLASPV